MLNTISAEAWDHVKKQYPEAWAFLVHESLKGELKSLKIQENLNEWQKRRLEELSNLFTSHYELAKAVGKHRKIDDAKPNEKSKQDEFHSTIKKGEIEQ